MRSSVFANARNRLRRNLHRIITSTIHENSKTLMTSIWSPGLVCCDQTQFSFLSFSGVEDFNLGSWWQMIPWTTWKIVHNRAWHSRSCVLMWNMKNNAPPSTLSARDLFLECYVACQHRFHGRPENLILTPERPILNWDYSLWLVHYCFNGVSDLRFPDTIIKVVLLIC